MFYAQSENGGITIALPSSSDAASQITQADVDRLHASGVLDWLGTFLFWTAEIVGSLVLASLLAYGLVTAGAWLRDAHRAVRAHRAAEAARIVQASREARS